MPPLRPNLEPVGVLGYPIETVLAEKLTTAIALGPANTRVRDYADIYMLCRQGCPPVSYRPVMTLRTAAQFADLSRQQEICEAFMAGCSNCSTRRGTHRWCSRETTSPSFARPCSVAMVCWRSG
jgi:hypothetical protein